MAQQGFAGANDLDAMTASVRSIGRTTATMRVEARKRLREWGDEDILAMLGLDDPAEEAADELRSVRELAEWERLRAMRAA